MGKILICFFKVPLILVYASNILGASDVSPSSVQVQTLDVPDAPSNLAEKGKSDTWVEFEFTVPHYYVAPITAYRLLKAVGEADDVIPLEQFQQHGTDFQGSLSTQVGETSNSKTSFRSNSPGNPAFDLDQLTNYHVRACLMHLNVSLIVSHPIIALMRLHHSSVSWLSPTLAFLQLVTCCLSVQPANQVLPVFLRWLA